MSGPRQITLGKFFGANAAAAPKKQSTLAFGSNENSNREINGDTDVRAGNTAAREKNTGNGRGKGGRKKNNQPKTKDGGGSELEEQSHDVDMKDSEQNSVKIEKSDGIEDGSKTETSPTVSRRKRSKGSSPVKDDSEESDVPISRKRQKRTGQDEQPLETKTKDSRTKNAEVRKTGLVNENGKAKKGEGKKEEVIEADPDKSKKENKAPKKEELKKPTENDVTSSGVGELEKEEEGLSESEAEELEEEKPELAKQTIEMIQTTLKGTGKDAYPDWKAGDPVPYAALCTTFSLIEMTTKRLVILSYCSLFLRQVLRLTPDDVLPAVQLMINKLAADYAGIELGIGESLIMKAIGESTGRSMAVIKADQNEIGDLGLVAAKSRSNQPTMFKPRPLTVKGVHQGLLTIAKTQGHGSQDIKISGIKKLLSAADAAGSKKIDITKDKGGPSEAKYIVRFLEGKLRLGLAEKTVLVALAQAMVAHEMGVQGKAATAEQLANGEAMLKTVYGELPSYEVIIPAMLKHGIFHLQDTCKLQPGVPLKPMLAKPTKSITEVLDRFEGKDFTCEYKYDGERAQIHYVSPEVAGDYATINASVNSREGLKAIFSRNSEDLSKKYPDVLSKLNTWIKPTVKSFVVDCETVAWDVVNRKVLPFQQLMTRKRKDVKEEDIKVKVCIFAFDLLFLNGEPTVRKTLRERRQLFHESFIPKEGEFSFAQYGNTNDLDAIQTLLDESVKASCEGLMIKMLDTIESSYEPSKRSRNWLKVKKDYLTGIGDSLDLAVLGAYYGKGKRTAVYGAFLLAAYNPVAQTFESVCNVGTGFSEAALDHLHATLAPVVIDRPKPFYAHSSVHKDQPDVWFEPRFVWEIKAADLTLSPRYMAARDDVATRMAGAQAQGKGVSLRFPRFIREREDKKPEQASTTQDVADMYRAQESVTGQSKGGVDDDFEY